MADAAALRSHLAKRRGSEIDRVHGHNWRAFGAAVAFERTDAEVVLERDGDALRQFFRAGHYEAQAAEFFRSAATQIVVEKSGSREEHGHGMFVDERADYAGIQRIGMKDNPGAHRGRQAERGREAKGMKKRQDTHDAVFRLEEENLIELLDVRGDVVVREHY